jgi:hypothetical protein
MLSRMPLLCRLLIAAVAAALLMPEGAHAQERQREHTPKAQERRTNGDHRTGQRPPKRTEPAHHDRPRLVRKAPPPPRRDRRTRRPSRHAVWAEGHWAFHNDRHVWVAGRWLRPRADHVWVQPAWQRVRGGWVFVPGRWTPQPQPEPRRPAPRRAEVPSHVHADIVRACSAATVGNAALEACIERARPLGAGATRDVEACGAQTVGNGGLMECLGAIRFSGPHTADAIHACGRATVGNGAVTRCVSLATRQRRGNARPVIESCSEATIGNSALLACVDQSLR